MAHNALTTFDPPIMQPEAAEVDAKKSGMLVEDYSTAKVLTQLFVFICCSNMGGFSFEQAD